MISELALILLLQIRHFKSSLKLVGKHARNFPIHSSKLRPYEKDYKAALAELEKAYKVNLFLTYSNRYYLIRV